jgi:hypothetical protein
MDYIMVRSLFLVTLTFQNNMKSETRSYHRGKVKIGA